MKKAKCPLMQWRCAKKGRDVCHTRSKCRGKKKNAVTCSKNYALKVDRSGKDDQCVGETKKKQKTQRCPVGWVKGSLISSGSNGAKKYACKTIRL